jgi:hypothetical protein
MESINGIVGMKIASALLQNLLKLLEAKRRKFFLLALHVLLVFFAKLHLNSILTDNNIPSISFLSSTETDFDNMNVTQQRLMHVNPPLFLSHLSPSPFSLSLSLSLSLCMWENDGGMDLLESSYLKQKNCDSREKKSIYRKFLLHSFNQLSLSRRRRCDSL